MTAMRPVLFRWSEVELVVDGGEVRRVKAMVPHARFSALCSRQFALQEDYPLGPVEGVPSRSRGGFFAAIKDAWNNLPEDDERFPTPEHLRKRALVGAGWATHAQYVMDTPKDAKNMARALRRSDEYAVIKVSAGTVDLWTAKSISAGTPGLTRESFQEIKTKALDWVATLARTTRKELEENAGRAA